MMSRKFVTLLMMIMATLLLATGCGGLSADDTKKKASGETTMEEGDSHGDDAMEDDHGDDGSMDGDDASDDDAADDNAADDARDEAADDEADAGGADLAAGKDVFTTSCGGCHTLDDAGTTGAVGPDLSGGGFSAAAVADIIANGQGGMPPGLASGDDAENIAAYVEDATK